MVGGISMPNNLLEERRMLDRCILDMRMRLYSFALGRRRGSRSGCVFRLEGKGMRPARIYRLVRCPSPFGDRETMVLPFLSRLGKQWIEITKIE